MYAYCLNNPVNYLDDSGASAIVAGGTATYAALAEALLSACEVVIEIGSGIVVIAFCYLVGSVAKEACESADYESLADRIQSVAVTIDIPREKCRNQSVYVLIKDGMVFYVGRTNDPNRRYNEHTHNPMHPERKNCTMRVVATGLTVDEARLLEQSLISAYTLEALTNRRREIAIMKLNNFNDKMDVIISLISGYHEDEYREMLNH